MTNDEIRQLILLAQETKVAELEVQRGDCRVRIRLAGPQEVFFSAPPLPSGSAHSAAPALPALSSNTPADPNADPLSDPSVVIQKSPIVGTFYEAASPDAPPFVRLGDTVKVGQVLCIIESMKLMNEIDCEFAGTIVAKLVENGHPVEYGESLFAIRPS